MPLTRATVNEPLALPEPKIALLVTLWSQARAGLPKVIVSPPA